MYEELNPYFKAAEIEAKLSPCVRRQYGAFIAVPGDTWRFVTGHNIREGRCCNGACVRERFDFPHGSSVEAGAEIHAETATLIKSGYLYTNQSFIDTIYSPWYFGLVGFDTKTQNELLGSAVLPCHMCILNIKFAGFECVYTRDSSGNINPIYTDVIIDWRERIYE